MKIHKFPPLLLLLLLCTVQLSAQTDDAWSEKPEFKFQGFVDVFYVYDFNDPAGSSRQPFLFNHNRHNEFNLNLGLASLSMDHSKYRARLSLQTGTYANDNYAAEPGVLKNIFEATVGIALNRKNTLWLDAGIMPSHLGFESAISMDNYTLTRSLSAENSPYFLTGAKVTFDPSERWEIAGLIVNGWQRIQRLEGNSLPSFGTQVVFKPSGNLLLNWSTFIGTDDPDETRRMRYFNNLYGQFQLTESIALIAGFDFGLQQRSRGSNAYELWLSPTIIGRYSIDTRWKTAFRLEYFQDKTGVIVPSGAEGSFQSLGLSWNLDYTPTPIIACRLEGRWMGNKDPFFETGTGLTENNFILATSIAIKIAEQF